MTRLLVSVRDAPEAGAALDGGADLIDVKEPLRGPLGAADPATIAAVARAVAGRAPVSAALGELLQYDPLTEERAFAESFAGVAYAKFGLAGCEHVADWPRRWARALEQLPPHVAPVAVIYADRVAAAAPPSREILEHAQALRCRAVLLDTYDKSGPGLLHLQSLETVGELIEQTRALGMLSVIGGSLSASSIASLLPLQPDFVAVRGAACEGNRAGTLRASLVCALAELVRNGRKIASSYNPSPSGRGQGEGM